MNNQQAINLLKNLEQSLDDYCGLNDEGETAFRMAIAALELFGNAEQLPSAEPERKTGRWIPCSERLPEMGKPVLWCNKHGSVFVSSITFKAEKCEYFTVGKHFDVVAWMPLPEPYRKENRCLIV